MNFAGKKWLTAIGFLLAFYVFLRFWNLTASCLWFDEVFSVHAATLPLKDLIWFVAQDLIHPPFFYIILKIWILLGGESLFWLRLFPFFFSVIFLVPFFLLSRELNLTPGVFSLALFFIAFSGTLIRYGQEVRMYGVLMFLAATAFWLLARFLRAGKGFWWLLAINFLLIYTQYHGWLLILAQLVAAFLLARARFKRFLAMAALLLAGFLPWVFAVVTAMRINADLDQNLGWAPKPDLQTTLYFLNDLHRPVLFLQSSVGDRRQLLFAVPLILILAPVLALYFRGWKRLPTDEKRRAALLLIWITTPVAAAFAASWILPFSVWGTRHAVFIYAPYYILASSAVSKISSRRAKVAFLGIVTATTLAAFVFHLTREKPDYIWCAWENLAQETARGEANDREKIYAFEDLSAYHLWFALRGAGEKFEIYKVRGVQPEDRAYFLPRGFDGVKTVDESEIEGNGFWIAFRALRWSETRPPLRNLRQKGYRIGEPRVYEAEGIKAFIVRVEK